MKNKIMIVGGYGQVGTHVCNKLIQLNIGTIVVAGRNYKKAIALSEKLNGRSIPRYIDIYNTKKYSEALKDISMVVMCLTPKNTDFVTHCYQQGIHYLDISPTNNTSSYFSSLKEKYEGSESSTILGVGLVPGLSNLMVKEAQKEFDRIDSVDIFLMLGLGEKHGKDGIRWLLNNINDTYTVNQNNEVVKVVPFINKERTKFPGNLKTRTAYSFNLADQHSIPYTLKINNVRSFFCYDSRVVTIAVSWLKQSGIFTVLNNKYIFNTFVLIFSGFLQIMKLLKLGSDLYSVKIDITGVKGSIGTKNESSIIGYNNSKVTGYVVAHVAKQIYEGTVPSGIHYIEEVLHFSYFNSILKEEFKYAVKTSQSTHMD